MNASQERVDFFVSYTGADEAWAEWIAWQLEEADYHVRIQAWDFVAGSNFVLEMDDAARRALRTIIVLSPEFLEAAFTRPEWAAAFRGDPSGAKRKLVPVRVAECDPSGLLGQITYIDLVGLDADEARALLLSRIRARAKPTEAPAFPGAAPHPGGEAPQFPGEPGATPRSEPLSAHEDADWVKLGDIIFPVAEITDEGGRVVLKAAPDSNTHGRLERLRDDRLGPPRLRLTFGQRVVDGQLASLKSSSRVGRREVEIELENLKAAPANAMRAGTTGMSADDLVEAGLREILLGEPPPQSLGPLSMMADAGVDREALAAAFNLPDPIAEPSARLILTEGLVGSGNASAIVAFSLGPRQGDARTIELEWIEPHVYTNVAPGRRRLRGDWRLAP